MIGTSIWGGGNGTFGDITAGQVIAIGQPTIDEGGVTRVVSVIAHEVFHAWQGTDRSSWGEEWQANLWQAGAENMLGIEHQQQTQAALEMESFVSDQGLEAWGELYYPRLDLAPSPSWPQQREWNTTSDTDNNLFWSGMIYSYGPEFEYKEEYSDWMLWALWGYPYGTY